MIADEFDSENLRNALCTVAEESTRYAKELRAQLKSMAIVPPGPGNYHLDEVIPETGLLYPAKEKGEEILFILRKLRRFFSKIYTDLLAEYFSAASLKEMMRYQLPGIQSAFMRIRFLNSLRFEAK